MSKLLLIDDEKPTRSVLGLYLRSKGYEVITAADGQEGVASFRKESPSIVLTDIKMPGMDGIGVLKRIKQISPETEVVVITGHGDMDLAIQSLQLGASDFITKPIANEALLIALKRAEERLDIRRQLKEYTIDLENKVREATEELIERCEFEGNLIQYSIDGIIATDRKGNVITFNGGAERILGFSRDEVLGKMHVKSIYPEWIAEEIRQGLYNREDEKGGLNNWQEITVLGKGGQKIPVRFSGTILHRNGRVIGSVGFFHDMREIKSLQQELIKSERLAAIGQTITGLGHYIKNILFGLQGGVYVVDKGLRKDDVDKLRTGWNMVRKNIDRIYDLVMDLLSYSKERVPEYKTCSPNTIVDDACELMLSMAEKCGIKIIRDIDTTIGPADLDPEGIHRCLINLISNAIDACMFDEDESKEHIVQVATSSEDDREVIFQVSDNGCGMDEKVRKKIFTSFFSTKGSKGTGLGLLVTQKIIQEHRGTIGVRSEAQKGSVFTVRLPIRHQEN